MKTRTNENIKVNKLRKLSRLLLMCSLAAAMAFALCACGGQQAGGDGGDASNVSNAVTTAVVYFSQTGNTEAVADTIAASIEADTYKLEAAEPYTEEDVSYGDDTRAVKEQADPSVRPEIEGDAIDLSGYDTVYIGYPIWYGDAPKIIYTFIESQELDGKTVIPFCTSDNTGIEDSKANLEKAAGSGNWLEGMRFGPEPTEDEIAEWLSGLEE